MLIKTYFFAKHPYITNPRRWQSHTCTFICNPYQCGLHISPSQSVGAGFPNANSPVEMWVLQLSMYACHCPCPAKGKTMGRSNVQSCTHVHPGKLCTHAAPALWSLAGWRLFLSPTRSCWAWPRQQFKCHRVTPGSVQSGPLLLAPLQEIPLLSHLLKKFRFAFRFTHF